MTTLRSLRKSDLTPAGFSFFAPDGEGEALDGAAPGTAPKGPQRRISTSASDAERGI